MSTPDGNATTAVVVLPLDDGNNTIDDYVTSESHYFLTAGFWNVRHLRLFHPTSMMLWRAPRLIGRAFTSETAQDWMTNTMFTASLDAGVNKDQGFVSCRTSFDSPSIQGTFSVVDAANRRSTDAPIRSMDIQRSMTPNNEARPRGLTDVLMNSNNQERQIVAEAMPRCSGEFLSLSLQ